MSRSGATAFFAFACLAASSAGCAVKDEGSPQSNSGNGGASGAGGSETGGTSAAGKGAAGNTTGGSAGNGGAGNGGAGNGNAGKGGAGKGGADSGSGGGSAGDGSAGDGSAGDGSAGDGSAGFTEVGVCGHRGESTVTDSEFSGFEEYFLIGEEGFGEDICVIRFDVERSGDPPGDCPDCEWSHAVRLSNPTVVLDTNGVCENSELGLGAAAIAELDGSEPAYGYVDEFAGHVSVLMKYDEDRSLWDAFGTATYDPDESTLKFERRNGFCNYRP